MSMFMIFKGYLKILNLVIYNMFVKYVFINSWK